MINRREFLVRMIGAAAAALVWPEIEGPAALAAPELEMRLTAPVWHRTFAAVHRQAFRIFRDEMARRGYPVNPAHVWPSAQRLGMALPNGLLLTNQRTVEVPPLGSSMDRAIEPAIVALAEGAAYDGLEHYALMELPHGVEHAGTVGPLRMVAYYDLPNDRMRVRFDVVGTTSDRPRLLARREHDRQAALVRRIKAGRACGESVHRRISQW